MSQKKLPTANQPEVIGQSVTGPKHREKDEPCQDNWDAATGDEHIIVAVSDGLGSAAHSSKGSEVATQTATETLQDWLNSYEGELSTVSEEECKESIKTTIKQARDNIQEKSDEDGADISEYHTTLSIAILTPYWYTAYAVGDSGIVGTHDGQHAKLVDREESKNQTTTISLVGPLTQLNNKDRFSYEQKKIEKAYLFTDGLDKFAWGVYDSRDPREEFFDRLSEFVESVDSLEHESSEKQLENFVDSDNFHEHSSDDKTLVVGHLEASPESIVKSSDTSGQKTYQDEIFLDSIEELDDATVQNIKERVECSKSTAYARLGELQDRGQITREKQGRSYMYSIADGRKDA